MATTNIGQVSIIPMGTFSLGTTYPRLSVVTYNGSSYIAKVENTNVAITDASTWYLLASKGDKGDTYEVTEADLQAIATQITTDANSQFNQNVSTKTTEFDNHVVEKKAEITSEGATQVGLVTAEGTTQVGRVTSEGTTQVGLVTAEGTTQVGLVNTAGSTQLGIIQAENLQLINQIPQGTASTTDGYVQLTDSSNLYLKDAKVYGNATQQTYSGKNLLPFTFQGGYLDASGNIYSDYTRGISTQDYIAVSASTTYTFSFDIDDDTLLNNGFVCEYDSEKTFIQRTSTAATKQLTFTTTSTTAYIRACIYTGTDNTISAEDITAWQLEIGSEATSYEPYVGGTASPNPDYPQAINVVTGDVSVKIEGKNLFNKNAITSTGWVDYNLRISSNNTYTISGILNASGWTFYMNFLDKNNNLLEQRTRIATGTYQTTTISNILENAYYLNLRFYVSSPNQTTRTDINTLQVEVGSTATTYEPYQSQTQTLSLGSLELAKIGDYADYIYKSGDSWYVHEEVGKQIFTGESAEGWFAFNTNTSDIKRMESNFLAEVIKGSESTSTVAQVFSNRYSAKTLNQTYTLNEGISIGTSGSIFIYDTNYNTSSSVSDFKTWLSSNNLILYYQLVTATDTEITDSTLLTQLEALLDKTTYKNVSNITISNTSATPILQVTYYKDLETLFNNINEAITALGTV